MLFCQGKPPHNHKRWFFGNLKNGGLSFSIKKVRGCQVSLQEIEIYRYTGCVTQKYLLVFFLHVFQNQFLYILWAIPIHVRSNVWLVLVYIWRVHIVDEKGPSLSNLMTFYRRMSSSFCGGWWLDGGTDKWMEGDTRPDWWGKKTGEFWYLNLS